MWNKCIGIIGVVLLLISCSTQRKMNRIEDDKPLIAHNWETVCDTMRTYKSIYFSKINARILLDEEEYNAKVSLYYLPDSVFLVSAVNSGFEIVRIGVFKDSMVFINRLEKKVYLFKKSDFGFQPPVTFKDIEYLVNKKLVCKEGNAIVVGDSAVIVNRSVRNVLREIEYSSSDLALRRFEFFHKKTGEYVVGDQTMVNSLKILSNFFVGYFVIEGEGGEIEYDRDIGIELSINRRKYDIIYL